MDHPRIPSEEIRSNERGRLNVQVRQHQKNLNTIPEEEAPDWNMRHDDNTAGRTVGAAPEKRNQNIQSRHAQALHAQALPLRTTVARANTEPPPRLTRVPETPCLAAFNGSYHKEIEVAQLAAQQALHGLTSRKAVSECGTYEPSVSTVPSC